MEAEHAASAESGGGEAGEPMEVEVQANDAAKDAVMSPEKKIEFGEECPLLSTLPSFSPPCLLFHAAAPFFLRHLKCSSLWRVPDLATHPSSPHLILCHRMKSRSWSNHAPSNPPPHDLSRCPSFPRSMHLPPSPSLFKASLKKVLAGYLDFTFQPEGLLSGLHELLTDVDLTGNRLKELPELLMLSRIQRLVLQENELSNLENLASLTTLTEVFSFFLVPSSQPSPQAS